MNSGLIGIILGAAVLLILLMAAVKVVPEYERGVIFQLWRIIGVKGPGLFVIIPVVDRMVRVSLRTVTMDIPPQDVITKDNVTVRVNAVTYFNVVDPNRSVLAIEDHIKGTSQIAQTTLRSILGQVDLDELLVSRDGHPAAMHLRILSTMTEVSSDRNSTLIFPLPMEILRLVDMLRPSDAEHSAPRPVQG